MSFFLYQLDAFKDIKVILIKLGILPYFFFFYSELRAEMGALSANEDSITDLLFVKKSLVPWMNKLQFFFKMDIKNSIKLGEDTTWKCFQQMSNFAQKNPSLWLNSFWNIGEVLLQLPIPYQQFFLSNF